MKNKILLALVATFSASSFAALPAAATTAFADITTAIGDMETAVWPILVTAFVALITIKLFKRFTGKI